MMKRLFAWYWLIGIICGLWSYTAVVAQTTTAIDIQARVGFANTYAVAHLTPVVLTVVGDTVDRDVRLEWAVTADRGTVVTWYHDLTLPARSSKQVSFTTVMPGYARSIVARVRDAQGILRSTIINAEPASDLLNVVVADDSNLLADLNQSPTPAGLLPVVRTIPPQELPDDIAALHGIYTLFVDNPSQLTPAQSAAIRTWIPLGGRVVFGGELPPAWQDVAAISIDRNTQVASSQLPATWPKDSTVPGAQARANAVPVREREGLWWRRSIGRGDVFHAALPLAAVRGWSEQAWYWQPVTEPSYPLSLSAAAFPAGASGSDVLINGLVIPAFTQLSPLSVFVIVVIYIIVIAPLTYVILKRRGTLDLAWVTIPITALIVTLMLIVGNRILRGDTTLLYGLTVVHQDDQATTAVATNTIAVYTPVRQRFTVQNPAATSFVQLATPNTIAVAQTNPTTHSAEYTSDVGDINYFMGIAPVPPPLQITHTLTRDAAALTGDMTIRGMSLQDVVVVYDMYSQHIGAVTPDVPVSIRIDPSQNAQFPCDEVDDNTAIFNLQRIYTQIAGPCGAVSALPNDRVTVYAWSDITMPSSRVTDVAFSAQKQLIIVTLVLPTPP